MGIHLLANSVKVIKSLLIKLARSSDWSNDRSAFTFMFSELRQQLKDCEENLSRLPGELISAFTEQSLQNLGEDMNLERQKLAVALKETEEKKVKIR